MELRMLGPLEVAEGDRVVDLGRRKQRALVAILSVSVNRVVALDRLISLLWGDDPPARAPSALHAYVCNLRRALEPTRAARGFSRVLITQPPGYMLRLEPDEVDACRFEALAVEGHRLLEERRPAASRDALARALAVWRGPVLGEFSLEPFARAEVVRLDELRAAAFEGLVQSELALGQHAQAVAKLELAVADSPLRENLWGMLMVALYRAGRQGDALRAFARARTVLAEELGVDPSPALRAVEADVLAHAPALDWEPPAAEGVVAGPAVEVVAGTPASDDAAPQILPDTLAMVGRDREMASLTAGLERARNRRGRLVLLSGEAGIGKTRLAEELARRALSSGVEVAWAGSSDTEGAPPFWPWSRMLQDLLEGAEGSDLDTPELADVVPLLPNAPHAAPAAEDPPTVDLLDARFRLYQGVTSLLRRRANQRPMLVVVDDLHWADRPSRQLLAHLASQVGGSRLLLVVTYRSEPRWVAALVETLGDLGRLQPLDRIELVGLRPDEVRAFLAEATGTEPSAAGAAEAHARTDGNPFLLVELARLMASEGPMPHAVPSGVREVIGRRLACLPEEARSLLLVAAVVGRAFDLAIVATASGTRLEAALEVIGPAVATGIVMEDEDQPGRYHFAHALVQEAVYGSASGLKRAQLHAQVGEAIEATGQVDSRLRELAHHFDRAAAAIGPDRGVSYSVMAAEVAQSGPAPEAAEEYLRRALTLLATMPEGLERDRRELEVQDRLATLLSMVRGITSPAVKAVWDRAVELCRRVAEPQLLVRSIWGIFGYALAHALLGDARQVAEQILDLGVTCDDVAAIVAGHLAAGTVEFHLGNRAAADERFTEAMETYERRPDPGFADVVFVDLQATAGAYLGMVRQLLGDKAEGLRLRRAAVARARADGGPFPLAFVLHVDAVACLLTNDLGGVRERAEEVLALAERNQFGELRNEATLLLGWLAVRDGDINAGLSAMEEAYATFRAVGLRVQGTLYAGLLADAQRRAGRVDEAIRTVEFGIAEMEATGERFYETELRRLRTGIVRERRRAASEAARAPRKGRVPVSREQMTFRIGADTTVGCPSPHATKS